MGRIPPPPFELVLVSDSVALARLTAGRAPGWGAGVAFPSAHAVVLRTDLPDLDRTLGHELGHLMLRTQTRTTLPLWFDEGYAAWANGELGRLEVLQLNLAVAEGQLPSFRELNVMLRGSASSAGLGYALAASAVAQLGRLAPPAGIDRLFEHLRGGEDFETSLTAATGLDLDDYEEAWQHALRRRYNLVTWLAAGGLWTVVALSLAFLHWYRRRRDRPRRAALDTGWVIDIDSLPHDEDNDTPRRPPVDQQAPRD